MNGDIASYLGNKKERMLKLGVNPEILDKAYEILINPEKRKAYLRTKEEKSVPKNSAYNFKDRYDENLIGNLEYKPEKELRQYTFELGENLTIFLTPTGEISYKTSLGLENNIQEFKLTKLREGKKVIDNETIYSNISINELTRDKAHNPNINYKTYVLYHLLSDERVKACLPYNHGYLGDIYENNNGENIGIRLDIENYSAVMKYYGERNQNKATAFRNSYKAPSTEVGNTRVQPHYEPKHAIDKSLDDKDKE